MKNKGKSSFEIGIDKMISKLKRLPSVAQNEVKIVLIETNEMVVSFEQERLFAGYTYDNKKIEPSYALSTIERKKRKGQPYNRVTLKDTGDLYKALNFASPLKLAGLKASFTMTAPDDAKVFYLEKKYANILGISKASVNFIAAEIVNTANPRLLYFLVNS